MFQSNSQCAQDLFVHTILNKTGGTFLDIGCSLPIYNNNSYTLEKHYGWSGVLIDIDAKLQNEIVAGRSSASTFLPLNMDNIGWIDAVKAVPGFAWDQTIIDYLSFDIDDSGLSVIETFPFNDFKFRVVTLEHDKYRLGQHVQDRMHEIMESHGYQVVCNNVINDVGYNGPKTIAFEDWWIHPDRIDARGISEAAKLKCDGMRWQEIEGFMR